MNFSTSIQIGARFKLIAHKGDVNSPTKQTDWFNNLVLDSGLNRLSVGAATTLVAVGTGNSTPVITQTALDSVLVTTSTAQGSEVTLSNTTTSPYYYGVRKTYRFGEGVAAGNLTEVGVGWATTAMFNRTLIKDTLGNPTTLTILSDEFLDIVVELRHYPQSSFTGSFNLLNKLGAVVSTHTFTGVPYISSQIDITFGFSKVTMSPNKYLYNGSANLGSITNTPSGTYARITTATETYPTSKSLRSVWSLGLSEANFNITSATLPVAGLCNSSSASLGYKVEISPPIAKNNTQVMEITFNLSWTRYTGA